MSATWTTGSASIARAERVDDSQLAGEELETFAIYVRIPEPGGDRAEQGTAGRGAQGDPNTQAGQNADEPRTTGSFENMGNDRSMSDDQALNAAEEPLEATQAVPDATSIAAAADSSPN